MIRYANSIVTAALVSILAAGAAMAEEKGAVAKRVAGPRAVTGVVNVNTATIADLALLPKVGPATAKRIVEFREKNGGFKKVEELLNVRGVGEKSLEALRPHLAISGPTTIKPVGASK